MKRFIVVELQGKHSFYNVNGERIDIHNYYVIYDNLKKLYVINPKTNKTTIYLSKSTANIYANEYNSLWFDDSNYKYEPNYYYG